MDQFVVRDEAITIRIKHDSHEISLRARHFGQK